MKGRFGGVKARDIVVVVERMRGEDMGGVGGIKRHKKKEKTRDGKKE